MKEAAANRLPIDKNMNPAIFNKIFYPIPFPGALGDTVRGSPQATGRRSKAIKYDTDKIKTGPDTHSPPLRHTAAIAYSMSGPSVGPLMPTYMPDDGPNTGTGYYR